jgi:hypothetical protein
MNVYVCEVRINATESMVVSIKAMTKVQAKTICRYTLRQRGYKVILKDINVMYIDNGRTPMN